MFVKKTMRALPSENCTRDKNTYKVLYKNDYCIIKTNKF